MEIDILIKNSTIYDGSLAEPYVADIGIKDAKIVAIGKLSGNAKNINAKGLAVTPGFIDVHTHSDLNHILANWSVIPSDLLSTFKQNYNYLYQGVTTIVTGNCGQGFTNINKWFDIVTKTKSSSNVYHLLPHGYLRQELFGKNQPTILSIKQLDLFKNRIAEQMEQGAIGLSTGLAYAPGYHASTNELIELAKVVAKYNGVYTSHMRDESGTILPNGNFAVLESLKEAIEIGKQANIPIQISHLKILEPANNAKASQILELIEQARQEGLDITADQYPYVAGSSHLTFLLPTKYQSPRGVNKEFQTKAGKKIIRKAIEEVFNATITPDKIILGDYANNKNYNGKTLQEIATMKNTNPVNLYAELACVDFAPNGIFFIINAPAMRELMPQPYVFTASDGRCSHPRTYGTFIRKLKNFVLEEKIMDMVAAIRSMTSLPAAKFHIKNRGEIKVGNYADLAVIDFNKLKDNSTYQNPHRYSQGIIHMLVNGTLTLENSKITGQQGGRACCQNIT